MRWRLIIGFKTNKMLKKCWSFVLRIMLKAFLIGVMAGLISSGLYILVGGGTWLFIPKWAWILYLPGFLAGFSWFEHYGSITLAHFVGWVTVGISYGIVSMAVVSLSNVLKRQVKRISSKLIVWTTIVTITVMFILLYFHFYDYYEQQLHLRITSVPTGATVFSLKQGVKGIVLGTTPLDLTIPYRIGKNMSHFGWSGWGITLHLREDGIDIRLACFIAKDGYYSQECTEKLSTVPKGFHKDQMPVELNYEVSLKHRMAE